MATGSVAEVVEEAQRPSATEEHVREMRYLLRARNHLLWVTTGEERRAERVIAAAGGMERYKIRLWDCATGARDLEGNKIDIAGPGLPDTLPAAVFAKIRQQDERAIWVLRDLHDWTRDPVVVRNLKSLALAQQDVTDKSRLVVIVVLSAANEVPLNLLNVAVRWDWPLPKRDEVAEILEAVIMASRRRQRITLEAWRDLPREQSADWERHGDEMEHLETPTEVRQRLLAASSPQEAATLADGVVDASVGLTADGMSAAMARSIVRLKRVDPEVIASEKKRMVSGVPGLTWYEPDPRGLEAIGGLQLLKEQLLEYRAALAPDAKQFGIREPRGILLAGPPGTGKSLTAKAAATAFGVPLIKLDLAATKGGIVGASEGNIRRALKTVEAVARCVLWVDEIDQALAGSTSSHTGDSGVAKDQLGTLLTFLQEHQGFIFLIATTNNPHRLPAELTRAGRFDGTFFVDLPNSSEREEILAVSLRALPVPRDPQRFDLATVASETRDFSGAELSELPMTALRRSFADGKREMVTDDLLAAASSTVPVARSASERVKELREWAVTRARPASEPESVAPRPGPLAPYGRQVLEIDPNDLDDDDLDEGNVQ